MSENEGKRLIKNTGIIAVGNMSTKIISFLLLPLYTKILSTSEYGVVDYITTLAVFIVPFISLLMDESMFRFLIDCKNNKEKVYIISSSMALIVLGSIVFLVIGIPILTLIKYKYTFFLLLYIISIVLSSMISALLRGIGRTDKYAIYNFLISTSNILLNIIFIAFLRLGVNGMLTASIISQLGISFIYIVTNKLWKDIDVKCIQKKKMLDMAKYSIPLIPNKISWNIINLSDRVLIMNFIGSSEAGLYAVSYKFPNLMDTVYGFFYQSWKESSARALNSNDRDKFYNEVYCYLKKFMFSLVLCMITFMPVVFMILIDDSYKEALLYIPPLLIGTYFANISGFYGGIFTAYKDTKIMGSTTIMAAILNIGINGLLISNIQLYAAAISTLISNLVVYFYRKVKVNGYVHLSEKRSNQCVSILVLCVILIAFYSMNIYLQIGGMILSLIYSIVCNIDFLEKILGLKIYNH